MSRPRRSLRARVFAWAGGGMLAVLAVSWVALYVLVRRSLTGEFDRLLAAKVDSLAGLVEEDEGVIDLEFDEVAGLDEFRRTERPEYYQAWAGQDQDRVLGRSPSLGGGNLPFRAGPPDVPAFGAITLPDGRPGRLAALTFRPRRELDDPVAPGSLSPHRVTLALARDTETLDTTLAVLGALLAAVGLGSVLLCAGVLALVVRQALRPLDRMAAEIETIGEDNLSRRIDAGALPAEMRPVGERLNELLARLEKAFARERTFSADVAHELRTPLAGLRSTLEVATAGPAGRAAYREALEEALAICREMQAMVENLLALARIDAGEVAAVSRPLELGELLQETWRAFEVRARERHLEVEWRRMDPIPLHSDREKLRLVLANLLDNAVSHCDPGGRVAIEAEGGDGRVRLTVTNTGSRLSRDEAQWAFARFWRGDAGRGDTGLHCGLGLPLARRFAELLGGSLAADSERGGSFRVTLSFGEGSVPALAVLSPRGAPGTPGRGL